MRDHKVGFLGMGSTIARLMMRAGDDELQPMICRHCVSSHRQVSRGIYRPGSGSSTRFWDGEAH